MHCVVPAEGPADKSIEQCAAHYGGDLIRAEKTMWCDPVLNEQPFNPFHVLSF
jgi:hypothetical protein